MALSFEEYKKLRQQGYSQQQVIEMSKAEKEPEIEKKGFLKTLIDKTTQSLEERVDKTIQIRNSDISSASKNLQTLGQGFATAFGDIPANIISTISPETSRKIGEVVGKVAETETAQKVSGFYNRFKHANPELAGNIEAVANIASAFPGTGAAVGVTKATVSAALNAGAKTAKMTGKIAEKTGQKISQASEFATSQVTGLNPNTVKQILKTPGAFTAKEMAKIDRESFANRIKGAIEKRLESLSETGKEYESIRKSGQKVVVPEGMLKQVLNKYGIDIDENGKVVTTAESVPLGQGDINAIEGFVKQYGLGELSGNAFLNARKALSNMAKFDASKTDMAQTISRELRAAYDQIGKSQLKGLSELDAKYAPEVKLLEKVKKELFNPDGSLKDTAISRLANLTGKGKEKALERMEKIVPGIREQVNILKAIEDIEYAKGQKVGTYIRGTIAGGGLATGNVPAIIGAIVSSPTIAVPLLRSYAKVKNISSKAVNGVIEKMKSGTKLIGEEIKMLDGAIQNASQKLEERIIKSFKKFMRDPKAGMSVKDIAMNIDETDRSIMRDFLDDYHTNEGRNPDAYMKALDLADAMGLNTKKMSNENIAEVFGNILDLHGNYLRQAEKGTLRGMISSTKEKALP
jgi:hypothetical protein